MPLEIKVGHRYRTRSGDVVEIVRGTEIKDYPFEARVISVSGGTRCLDEGGSLFYTKTGRERFGQRSYGDLIEELPADVDLLEGKPK